MNYLLIALLFFYFVNKSEKTFDIKGLLSSIPVEDIIPLLPMLGINEQTVSLISNALPAFLNGNFDASNLIKTVIPLLGSLSTPQNQEQNFLSGEGVTPLNDIAPTEILNGLTDYFS